MMLASAASTAPRSEVSSQGWATAQGMAGISRRGGISPSYLSWVWTLKVGRSMSGIASLARAPSPRPPGEDLLPSWLVQRQSRRTVSPSASLAATVTVAVTVSPRKTGARKWRFWPR